MGDLETLRLAQAAVAACVFLLLTFGTYRPTRSRFAAWWAGVVGASGLGTAAYVMGESGEPAVAAAVGNGLSVLAASLAWLAARSLRGRSTPWWFFVGPGAAIGLATWWERPEGSAWPAGVSLLVGMAVMLGLSAVELAAVRRANSSTGTRARQGETGAAISTLMVASLLASAFYVVRVVTFLTVGPDSDFYVTWVGPYTATFLIMLMLVVVSYTVTALSHYEMARGWRARAQTDDLTGMLHRSAFLQRSRGVIERERNAGQSPVVIVADLDHFKAVNDAHGHPFGDRVLVSFARAVRETLGEHDLAARFGGEEFAILLADADVSEAVEVTESINLAFESMAEPERGLPTVSYGVARVTLQDTLEAALELADTALYRAKRSGRARVQTHDDAGSSGQL